MYTFSPLRPAPPPQLFGAAITPGPWLREWFVGAAAPFPKPRDGRDSAIPRRSPPALTLEYFTTSNFNKARKCKREGACLHMPPTLLTNHRPVCAHRMAHHGDYGHRRPAVAETGAPPPTQKPLPAGENNARSSLLPSSVSLSHSLSFGRAGRHHFGSTSRRLRQDMISQPVEGRLPIPPPAPLFSTLHPGSLPRFFDLYLSASLFPFFWAGQTGFFWVSAGTVAAQCVIASTPAEEREMSLATNIPAPCPRFSGLFFFSFCLFPVPLSLGSDIALP